MDARSRTHSLRTAHASHDSHPTLGYEALNDILVRSPRYIFLLRLGLERRSRVECTFRVHCRSKWKTRGRRSLKYLQFPLCRFLQSFFCEGEIRSCDARVVSYDALLFSEQSSSGGGLLAGNTRVVVELFCHLHTIAFVRFAALSSTRWHPRRRPGGNPCSMTLRTVSGA